MTESALKALEDDRPDDLKEHVNEDTVWEFACGAIEHGSIKCFRLLMEMAPDCVSAATEDGWTLLHQACCDGRRECLDVLLDLGADASACDEFGWTPLHESSSIGNVELTNALLAAGADVNGITEEGSTALHVAAAVEGDEVAAVCALLSGGAAIFAADGKGLTPLHVTANLGRPCRARALLEVGSDVNAQDQQEWTPLHHVAVCGATEVARILLEAGAVCSAVDAGGGTALHLACNYGHGDVASVCIEKGGLALVNIGDDRGWLALHEAVNANSTECTTALIEAGADVNAGTEEGHTPLHIGVQAGALDCLRCVLAAAPNPNLLDFNGMTPLHLATESKNLEVVKLLVEGGADVTVVDGTGGSILHQAAFNGAGDVLDYLLTTRLVSHVDDRSQQGTTPLQLAASSGHSAIVEVLVAAGADVIGGDSNGWTALFYSVLSNDESTTSALLSNGSVLDAKDCRGRTPLHVAAENGAGISAQTLVERGAEVSAQDDRGWTPLHECACAGHAVLCAWLLDEGGAQIEARTRQDLTPLHVAACYGRVAVVDALLARAADVLAVSEADGLTAIHLAANRGHRDCLELFCSLTFDNGDNVPDDVLRPHLYARDRNGDTALHHAAISSSGEAVLLLLEHGVPAELQAGDGKLPLHLAVGGSSWRVLDEEEDGLLLAEGRDDGVMRARISEMLIHWGAAPNAKDSHGYTAFHHAVLAQQLVCLPVLIDGGGYVDVPDLHHRTALHLAAQQGDAAAIDYLLDGIPGCEANVEAIDDAGNTALHFAVHGANVEAVRHLLEVCPRDMISARNGDGRTALRMAASLGHVDIVALLLEAGSVVDADVLSAAEGKGHSKCAALIAAHEASAAPAPPPEGDHAGSQDRDDTLGEATDRAKSGPRSYEVIFRADEEDARSPDYSPCEAKGLLEGPNESQDDKQREVSVQDKQGRGSVQGADKPPEDGAHGADKQGEGSMEGADKQQPEGAQGADKQREDGEGADKPDSRRDERDDTEYIVVSTPEVLQEVASSPVSSARDDESNGGRAPDPPGRGRDRGGTYSGRARRVRQPRRRRPRRSTLETPTGDDSTMVEIVPVAPPSAAPPRRQQRRRARTPARMKHEGSPYLPLWPRWSSTVVERVISQKGIPLLEASPEWLADYYGNLLASYEGARDSIMAAWGVNEKAVMAWSQNKLELACSSLEQCLAIFRSAFADKHPAVLIPLEQLAAACNSFGVTLLTEGNAEAAFSLLSKAEILTRPPRPARPSSSFGQQRARRTASIGASFPSRTFLRALTFSNMATYFHSRNLPSAVLQYINKTERLGSKVAISDDLYRVLAAATTQLRASHTLGILARHKEALQRAQLALRILERASPANSTEQAMYGDAKEYDMLLSVLSEAVALAHHGVAAEMLQLRDYEGSYDMCLAALQLCTPSSQLAYKCKKLLVRADENWKMQQKMTKNGSGARFHATKTRRSPGLPPIK